MLKNLIFKYPELFLNQGVMKAYLKDISLHTLLGEMSIGMVREDMAIAICDEKLYKEIDMYERRNRPIKYKLSFDSRWGKDGNKLSWGWDVSSKDISKTGHIEDGHGMLIITQPEEDGRKKKE